MFLYIFEVDFSIEAYFRMILGSFPPPPPWLYMSALELDVSQ